MNTFSRTEKLMAVLIVLVLFSLVGISLAVTSHWNRERTEKLHQEVRLIKRTNYLTTTLAKTTLDTRQASTTAKSFLVVAVSENGQEKILAQKEPSSIRPIASLTKLALALVISKQLDLNNSMLATKNYVGGEESFFILKPGEQYLIRDLLQDALIASDNDASRLLASAFGEEKLVEKMNQEARTLGLNQTQFFNVTGLDPQATTSPRINVSSASNLVSLMKILKTDYREIIKITTKPDWQLCSQKNICTLVKSTNKLLTNSDLQLTINGRPVKIIGGKTGNTDRAGKNLLLLTEVADGLYIISVVLGAEDAFGDTISLFNSINLVLPQNK